jgi:hypothetical protein
VSKRQVSEPDESHKDGREASRHIRKLAKLHADGMIDSQEFESARTRLRSDLKTTRSTQL